MSAYYLQSKRGKSQLASITVQDGGEDRNPNGTPGARSRRRMWLKGQHLPTRLFGTACVTLAVIGCRSTRELRVLQPVAPPARVQPTPPATAEDFIDREPARMAVEDQKRAAEALEHEEASTPRKRTPHRDSPLRPPPRR